MKRAIAALLLGLLASSAEAEGVPIQVTADTFTVDQVKNLATFTGNVEIIRTGLSMWADLVVVHYGAGGQTDINSLEATGNVKIKTREQQATGRRAVFNPATQILKLSDNVTVVGPQGTVHGPELTIDLEKNTSMFKGSDGGRVTGVFTPK